jgi:uncharacterized protein
LEEPPLSKNANAVKYLLIVSLTLNVALAAFAATLYLQTQEYASQLKSIAEENNSLNQRLMELQKAYEVEKSQLEYYRRQAEYYTHTRQSTSSTEGLLTGVARVNLVAVKTVADSFTTLYEGVVLSADIELRPGQGRILIDTKPRIGIDLQSSLRTAVTVAENITGVSFNSTDVILTVSYKEDVDIVDGPSAGAAITIGLIAAVKNASISPDVYITGTVNPDGTVGKVGGILEKAEAAARMGARKFILPKGQTWVTGFREVRSEPIPGFIIVTYEPYQLDLKQRLQEKGYNVEVLEADRVLEAYQLAIS